MSQEALQNVPTVSIDPSGGYKFIVAKITDGSGGQKLVIRANGQCDYHRDILEDLRDQINGLNASCIGWGRIEHDPDAKTIKIWDSSGDFGGYEPDRDETVRMLQEAYPDYEVTVIGGY
ncbi:hypothetical protein L0Y49_05175 [bacterium]|nr:hypothetical protein [bacterium]